MAKAMEIDFPLEKHVEQPYNLETTGVVHQKLFSEEEVDPDHVSEAKRIMGIKPVTICSPRCNFCHRIQ
jgi:hypothetical protein